MSTAAGAADLSSAAGHARKRDLRLLLWGFALVWLAALGWSLHAAFSSIHSDVLVLVPWVLVLWVVNLLPIREGRSVVFTPDLPITTAGALVLVPPEAALVAFLGTLAVHRPERWRNLSRVLFDSCQVGLCAWVGSMAVHLVSDQPQTSPWILLLAFLALASDLAANLACVVTVVALESRENVRRVTRRMKIGSGSDLALTFLAWGTLAGMLTIFYDRLHAVALLAFIAPTLLGRQVLRRSQSERKAKRAYELREGSIRQLSRQMERERVDERRLVAADLHDEVLQPLFKVSLMSHVLKADLSSGRLLEMEQDLPELLAAAELASATLRGVIGDLRRSALGLGGLAATLGRLLDETFAQTDVALVRSIEDVDLPPSTQLTLYQVAKEAVGNVVRHSRAEHVWVELRGEDDLVCLTLRDDGIGFDPYEDRTGHFGIHIMRERTSSVGGSLYLDSARGQGCRITVIVPASPPPRPAPPA